MLNKSKRIPHRWIFCYTKQIPKKCFFHIPNNKIIKDDFKIALRVPRDLLYDSLAEIYALWVRGGFPPAKIKVTNSYKKSFCSK